MTFPPNTPLASQALRSLAFALLSRREYSAEELKQKLLSAGGIAEHVDTLIKELAMQSYQSDERMAGMVVRSNINKGRGPARIQQELKKHRINEHLAQEDMQQIDWLQQAVALRIKKFGETLPTDQKEKARQLRFLQYRGFDLDTCFKALVYTEEE